MNQEDERRERWLLRQQYKEILFYVNQFPSEEREERILEWIERYASNYRHDMEEILEFVERQTLANNS